MNEYEMLRQQIQEGRTAAINVDRMYPGERDPHYLGVTSETPTPEQIANESSYDFMPMINFLERGGFSEQEKIKMITHWEEGRVVSGWWANNPLNVGAFCQVLGIERLAVFAGRSWANAEEKLSRERARARLSNDIPETVQVI